ncbi:DUF7563 family protein [Halobacterium salinarum]
MGGRLNNHGGYRDSKPQVRVRRHRKPISAASSGRYMPKCQNCGSHVTDVYVRVFTPDDVTSPRACPSCETITRDRNGIREKRP